MTLATDARGTFRALLRTLVRKDAAHAGAMVALFVPAEVGAEIAIPGGEAPGELHITLAYLAEDAAAELDDAKREAITAAVGAVAAKLHPLSGSISGSGRFNGDAAGGKPVVYATADLPGLVEARVALVAALAEAGIELPSEHDFTPHITLAYGTEDLPDVPTTPIEIREVVVVFAGERFPYPLGGTAEQKAARLADAIERRAEDVALAAAESGLLGQVEIQAEGFDELGRVLFVARSGEASRAFVEAGAAIEPLRDVVGPPAYRVVKAADAQRYTLGVVYPARRLAAPKAATGARDIDTHGDSMTADEVELAAWRFMQKPDAGLMHKDGTSGAGIVVESYIYRGPTWKVEGQVVEAGDWLAGVVWSPEAWANIESGALKGYSLQGFATKEDVDAEGNAVLSR